MTIHIHRDDQEELATVAERLRHIGHPTRLAMVTLLRREPPLCVCALAAALDEEQATVSRHLRILKDSGLLRARRDGVNVFYSLDRDSAGALLDQLARALGREPGAGAAPRRPPSARQSGRLAPGMVR